MTSTLEMFRGFAEEMTEHVSFDYLESGSAAAKQSFLDSKTVESAS